ncbi:hypothetical protein ACFGVR_03485 [Mucilaginibacter sp. AW1-3]
MKKIAFVLLITLKCTFGYAQTDSVSIKEKLKIAIVAQTKEGGKYDFFTPIKGQEYNGSQIKPGIYATNIEVALIKWGKVNHDLGVKSLQDAYDIFAEYKGRKLNQREIECIKMGFNGKY